MTKPNDLQNLRAKDNNVAKQNTPSAPANNPIKQIVDIMKKVDLKSPDAAKNEKSITDKNGKRINLDDEDVRFNYFKGVFERKSPTNDAVASKK